MSRIDTFLTALEEERYEIDLARRRRPGLGRLHARNADLFSLPRIAQVQRELAGSTGIEERRTRSLLEFLARGRAVCQAAGPLDQKLGWEIFGAIAVDDDRIPIRQVSAALAITADPARRHAIEEAHLVALAEQRYLADDYLVGLREGIAEIGYGSHVEAFQVLGGIDLLAMVRDGERFLADSEAIYRELLAWHLPRLAAVDPAGAKASDGRRLEAAVDYEAAFPAGERNRSILDSIGETGLDPLAEGRIDVAWGAYLGVAAGAVCTVPRVPERVRIAVSTRSGRHATASFLSAYGTALHCAYTDPSLPVEQRRLGDESVPPAAGALFHSLLRVPAFVTRVFGIPQRAIAGYLRCETLAALLTLRREVGLLRYELAHFRDGAGPDDYAEILTAATGLRHDARGAAWELDGQFAPARRIRAAELGAVYASLLRQRFDEDWFRNPKAGGFLRDLFSNGRRFSAPELAVQLTSRPLGFDDLMTELKELV